MEIRPEKVPKKRLAYDLFQSLVFGRPKTRPFEGRNSERPMLHGIEIPEKVVPSLSRKANMRTTNSIVIPAECSLGTARSGRLSAFSQMLRNLKNACKVSVRMLFSPHPLSAFTKKEKIEPLRPKADGYVEDGQGPRSKQTVRFLNPLGYAIDSGIGLSITIY
jgi:hypothetical protein